MAIFFTTKTHDFQIVLFGLQNKFSKTVSQEYTVQFAEKVVNQVSLIKIIFGPENKEFPTFSDP